MWGGWLVGGGRLLLLLLLLLILLLLRLLLLLLLLRLPVLLQLHLYDQVLCSHRHLIDLFALLTASYS